MNKVILVLGHLDFVSFIKRLLSSPGRYEYHTKYDQLTIQTGAVKKQVQREIYDWLAERVDDPVSWGDPREK